MPYQRKHGHEESVAKRTGAVGANARALMAAMGASGMTAQASVPDDTGPPKAVGSGAPKRACLGGKAACGPPL